jgi:hypothetical protein
LGAPPVTLAQQPDNVPRIGTARALGVPMPPSRLLQEDQVIE